MTAGPKVFAPYAAPEPEFVGQWQAVLFTPDLASHQSYVVGVVATEIAGKLAAFRLLQDFAKLQCIYGETVAANVSYLFDRARNALIANQKAPAPIPNFNSISPHFTLTSPLYLSGLTAVSATNEIYQQVVALEPEAKARKQTGFQHRDTTTVRNSVHELLKVSLGLDFERYIHPAGLNIRHEGKSVDLAVDVFDLSTQMAAAITSGWYSNRPTIELHAMRSFLDLQAARQHFHTRIAGLILVRPVEGLPASALDEIDHFVGDFEIRAKESGLKFAAPSSDEEAATLVGEMIRETKAN